jgi:putative DNA primase/helicase
MKKEDAVKRVDKALEGAAADTEIKRLAESSRLQYEKERKSASERLGVRASILDRLVEAARKEQSSLDQGSSVVVEDVEPWPDPIDGAALLDEMAKAMASHIAMQDTEADTIALWCVYSHAFELFPVAPRLGIRAATAECGKTEALRRIKRFVNRPLECDGLTAPVFFRVIDAYRPTFLLDELDNMLPEDKSAMLGAMNSGYSRKGRQLRCVGDEHEVRAFRTFAPFVYAMVGKPTNTFDSRTIAIELRRATPEKARALLSLEDDDAEDKRLSNMGRRAGRWVSDNRNQLAKDRPDMGELVNRPAMNWRPLFAVADQAGGDWPGRARKAAAAATKSRGDQDIKAEHIIDIKSVMDANPEMDEWPSAMLAEHLGKLEGRPWAEFGRAQKPITQNAVARLLKPFGIAPGRIGPEGSQARGYCRWQFEEAFAAYAPPPSHNRQGVKNAMDIEQVGNSQPSSPDLRLTVGKSQKPASSLSSRHLDGCKQGVGPKSGENATPTSPGGGARVKGGPTSHTEKFNKTSDNWQTNNRPAPGNGKTVPEGDQHRCKHCGRLGAEPWDLAGRKVLLHQNCHHAWADAQAAKTKATAKHQNGNGHITDEKRAQLRREHDRREIEEGEEAAGLWLYDALEALGVSAKQMQQELRQVLNPPERP